MCEVDSEISHERLQQKPGMYVNGLLCMSMGCYVGLLVARRTSKAKFRHDSKHISMLNSF